MSQRRTTRRKRCLAAQIPNAKPEAENKRRAQHSGTRNAQHVSLLQRAVEPLSFLKPLLLQSDEAYKQEIRKLEQQLGMADSSSSDVDDDEESVAKQTSPSTNNNAESNKKQ
jgi:hypothetical protein